MQPRQLGWARNCIAIEGLFCNLGGLAAGQSVLQYTKTTKRTKDCIAIQFLYYGKGVGWRQCHDTKIVL